MKPASRAVDIAAACLAALVAWQVASLALGKTVLAGPLDVLDRGAVLIAVGEFWAALGATLLGTLLGLTMAACIAVPLGLVLGGRPRVDESTRLVVDFLACVPPITLVPLALLMYGPTLSMKLVLVVFGAFWPLLSRTKDAVRQLDPVMNEVAFVFGIERRRHWLRIVLPATLPGILLGLRVSLTIALLLSIAAELVGGAPGLGAALTQAQLDGRSADVTTYVSVAALLGIALNAIMRVAERSLIEWHPSVRGSS